MKAEKPPPLERKSQNSALWFYGRMYLIFLLIPVLPYILRFIVEAALWCYVLANVPGVVFAGGFREALALSVCLQVIITFVELAIKVSNRALSKSSNQKDAQPLESKESEAELSPIEDRLASELKGDWRRTLKLLSLRFISTALILFMLSKRFPVQLSFTSPIFLCGCSFLLTTVFYLHLTFMRETMVMMLEKVKKQSDKFKNGAA